MPGALTAVFMGTPEFAVPSLRATAAATALLAVVTQPDRPAGRGRRLEPPPVKVAAAALGVEPLQPETARDPALRARLAELAPDVIVTAAYGRILGRRILDLPPYGCLNVHASLLPAYRGAAPVARAILAREARTGVSIMRMDAGLDTGPVYAADALAIGADETAGELTARLAELGAGLLAGVLARLPGGLVPTPQRDALATLAPPLAKEDGRIDWSRSAAEVHAHVRAMHPWPCAFTALGGEALKVHRAALIDAGDGGTAPGVVLEHSRQGLDVACGQGSVRLLEVQLPGRRRLDAASFHAGCRLDRGARLG